MDFKNWFIWVCLFIFVNKLGVSIRDCVFFGFDEELFGILFIVFVFYKVVFVLWKISVEK